MAGRKSTSAVPIKKQKPKVRRKGIHAKTKTSKLKQSKLYKKLSVGQGK
jgi:hypothetical protein